MASSSLFVFWFCLSSNTDCSGTPMTTKRLRNLFPVHEKVLLRQEPLFSSRPADGCRRSIRSGKILSRCKSKSNRIGQCGNFHHWEREGLGMYAHFDVQ